MREIFNLTSLNPSIGGAGETCFNFVTHLRAPEGLFDLSDAELAARYKDDFRRVFGHELDPLWTVVNRVRAYSPIFTPSYRNVPVRSTRFSNVYFTGNYRTFPSITSTGTALGAGLETAEAIDAQCGTHARRGCGSFAAEGDAARLKRACHLPTRPQRETSHVRKDVHCGGWSELVWGRLRGPRSLAVASDDGRERIASLGGALDCWARDDGSSASWSA